MTWILGSAACFGLAVVLHGAAMRVPLRMDSVSRFVLVAGPLGCALVLAALKRADDGIDALAAILLYAFACELYIFCFTLVMSSVSATMLILLRKGPVDAGALTSTYDPRGMVELRLDRLLKNGMIGRRDGLYTLTPKGARLHRAFGVLRRFFGHE